MKKSAKFMDEADPLIDCLKDHLWGITKSHGQSTSKLIIPGEKWWDEATKPYNTRIEGRVGPLALVYREPRGHSPPLFSRLIERFSTGRA